VGFLDATDISPIPSGLDKSNPKTYGADMSGILAATAVALVAEAENAEGKKIMFELHSDLCNQSNE
jgi:hypothetical protein